MERKEKNTAADNSNVDRCYWDKWNPSYYYCLLVVSSYSLSIFGTPLDWSGLLSNLLGLNRWSCCLGLGWPTCQCIQNEQPTISTKSLGRDKSSQARRWLSKQVYSQNKVARSRSFQESLLLSLEEENQGSEVSLKAQYLPKFKSEVAILSRDNW